MKPRLPWLPAALGLLAATPALAQNELSNFSATGRGGVANTFALDYQSLGINPANLGRQGTSLISFTVGEVGAGVGSQSLTNSQFKKLIFHANDALSAVERTALVANLNSNNALNINADATAFGLAVTLPGSTAVAGAGAGVTVHVEFGVIGSAVTARVWTGATRPTTATFTGTDTAITLVGSTSLALNDGSATTAITSTVANYVVTDY